MVAVISGATKGIGRAVAIAFAELGFDLALGARNIDDLERFKSYLHANYSTLKIYIHSIDFSKKNEINDFAEEIKKEFDTIDVLVNNVGIYSEGVLSEEQDGILETNIQTNLYSAYYLTKPFLEKMKVDKSGYIFNICSVLSKIARKEAASYTISKFALIGFNKVLTEEMRDYGVKVTAVLPGSVNTASWENIEAPKDFFVQPSDIANAIVNAYRTSKYAFIEEIIIKPLNRNY